MPQGKNLYVLVQRSLERQFQHKSDNFDFNCRLVKHWKKKYQNRRLWRKTILTSKFALTRNIEPSD